jgi:hypothetical protein
MTMRPLGSAGAVQHGPIRDSGTGRALIVNVPWAMSRRASMTTFSAVAPYGASGRMK